MEILLGCMLVVATLLLFLPASNGWYRLMRTAGYPRKSVLSMGVRARAIGSAIGFPLLLVVAFALRHAIVPSMLIMLVAIWVASQIGSALSRHGRARPGHLPKSRRLPLHPDPIVWGWMAGSSPAMTTFTGIAQLILTCMGPSPAATR